jgi:hypothetical protein
VLGLGLGATGGAACEPGAHAFVARIYADHVDPNEGFALDADRDLRRYFEPAPAERMIRAMISTGPPTEHWSRERRTSALARGRIRCPVNQRFLTRS